MSFGGIPGMSGTAPASTGIPVTTGFNAQQQQMQANAVMGNTGPDPDALMKAMMVNAGGANNGGSFNWASYNQSQTKTPLDSVAAAMGANQQNEDVYYKGQVKLLSANIFARMNQEINTRTGQATEKLVRGIELAKFGYLQSDTHRYQCQVRTRFVDIAKENRALMSTIGRNAAAAAVSIAAQMCVEDQKIQLHPANIYGFFEQWVINFTMLEMVNWINYTEVGKLVYTNCRTKELEQTLGTIQTVIGCVGTLFSWFGLDNPYNQLELKNSGENSTAINAAVIPRGMEAIMAQAMGAYQGTSGTTTTSAAGNLSQDEFLKQQLMMYSNQPAPAQQTTYPNWETPVTYNTAPMRIGGRNDYKFINNLNMHEFDLTFLIPVPYEHPEFKGKVYVTRSSTWNDVKYKLDYAYPDPKRWSGDWIDDDMFYLVVFNERNQWYEQIVNTRDKDWMTSKIISDPERLLPDLVLVNGNLELRHTKESEPLGENKFSDIFEKDELNIPKIVKPINIEQGGAIIVDDSVLKTPAMQLVHNEIEEIAGKMKTKLADDDMGIYMKPVVNISKKEFDPDDIHEVMSFAGNINFFTVDNKDLSSSIVDIISAIDARKEDMMDVSESVYEFVVEKLTRGLSRWLVEKRGYIGLTIENCVDEIKNILSLLQRMEDRATIDLLKNGKDHEWIYGVARDIYEKVTTSGFEEDPSITMIKQVVINRVVNYPHPDYQKDVFVIKRSEFPELFVANERSNELAKDSFRGQHDVIFAFDDGQWWSFTVSGIDENTAVMRRLLRKGSLVDWKLGLSY